jgi:hypothetical protein
VNLADALLCIVPRSALPKGGIRRVVRRASKGEIDPAQERRERRREKQTRYLVKSSWRVKNREKIAQYNREYRAKNREKIAISRRAWAKANPAKERLYARRTKAKWRAKNKAKVAEYDRKYAAKHRAKINASKRAWHAANRERVNARRRAQRAARAA